MQTPPRNVNERDIRRDRLERGERIDIPSGTEDPLHVVCPSCRQTVYTRVEYHITLRTHLCAIILCCCGCWCCACLPYCTPMCLNTCHYCPICNTLIGPHPV